MIPSNKTSQSSQSSSPSYPTYLPGTNIALVEVLSTLTQKLSYMPSTATHEQVLIKLLQKIDPYYFQEKFSLTQTYDYELILKCMIDYYNDKRYEKITKIFLVEGGYVNKFQHVFKLVLDLAMNCNQMQKQRYIEQIINMSDRQKQILMPYFDQVTKRKFIHKLIQFHKYTDTNQIQHTQQDQLLQIKDQQYQQIKQNHEQLNRMYYQLLDNHNNMKTSYDKLLLQNAQIIQEKCQLMNQLGVHHSASFMEIADKYKRDVGEFIRELEKLHKEIQEKNTSIKNKDTEIKQLNVYGGMGAWQQERNILIQKIRKMQAQIATYETKQQKLNDELEATKNSIKKLKQDIKQKQEQIKSLSKIKGRYKDIKDAHKQFTKNMMQRTMIIGKQ